MPKITIDINSRGEIDMDIHGILGKSCKKVADDIAMNVGRITEQDKTDDYYKNPPNVPYISNRNV